MISDVILPRTAKHMVSLCPGTYRLRSKSSACIFSVQVVTDQKKPLPIQQSVVPEGNHAGQPDPTVCISDTHKPSGHWKEMTDKGQRKPGNCYPACSDTVSKIGLLLG